MKSRNNREERDISISELWWYVISKWKWYAIGMIIGAILFAAFGAYKATSSNGVGGNIDITMEDLTEAEQKKVQTLIEKTTFYKDKKLEYDNSYLMGLNCNTVYRCMITYYVDTDYSYNYLDVKDDYATELVSMYKTYIASDEIRAIIVDLDIDGLSETDLNYMLSASNEGDIFKIAICATAEDCEKIATAISVAVEAYFKEASETIGEHTLTCIGSDIVELYNENIKNGQSLKTTYINSLADELSVAKKSLSDREKAVYEAEMSGKTAGVNQSKGDLINKKYIVLGVIGGAVFGVAVAIINFIMGGKLKTVSEISQISGIEILGKVIKDSTGQKAIACKLNKIKGTNNESEQKKYVAQTILNICKQNDYAEVVFCSSVDGLSNEMDDIAKILKDSDIICVQAGDVNVDSNALDVITQSKNVVFVEKINQSLKEDVLTALDKCETLSANVLGMVIIV